MNSLILKIQIAVPVIINYYHVTSRAGVPLSNHSKDGWEGCDHPSGSVPVSEHEFVEMGGRLGLLVPRPTHHFELPLSLHPVCFHSIRANFSHRLDQRMVATTTGTSIVQIIFVCSCRFTVSCLSICNGTKMRTKTGQKLKLDQNCGT